MAHLRSLPVILTCVTGKKTQKMVLWVRRFLDFLIGVKWHGRGRRFEPDHRCEITGVKFRAGLLSH